MIAGRSFYLSTSSHQAMTASSVFFRIRHQVDPETRNCIACGASYEWMLAHRGDACSPDGNPHPRALTDFAAEVH